MDKALQDERLELMIKHTAHRETIAQLRKEQRTWSERIAEIDRIDTIERLNPNESLNQGVGGPIDIRAHLGIK